MQELLPRPDHESYPGVPEEEIGDVLQAIRDLVRESGYGNAGKVAEAHHWLMLCVEEACSRAHCMGQGLC